MIRMEDALAKENLAARMLLQVHDELIFEVPENEVEKTIPVVRRVMEMRLCLPSRLRCRCVWMQGRRITGTRRIEFCSG